MNRRSLLIIAVALALIIVAVRWHGRLNPTIESSASREGTSRQMGSDASSGVQAEPLRILQDELTATGRVFTVSKAGQERRAIFPPGDNPSKEEIEFLAFPPAAKPAPTVPIRTLLNQHLSFYGLAMDENTNAVAGANVEAVVQVMNGEGPATSATVRLSSDADGRFTVEHPWGQLVMITVTKKPEFIDAQPQWFQYGPVGSRPRHVPNIVTPVVFELHRVQKAEPLFAFSQQYRAPNTGEPVRVDFTTGKLVGEGGDLVVSIVCPQPYTELKNFPWKLSVEVPAGGLVEVPSSPQQFVRLENLHMAPPSGYVSGFSVEYGQSSERFQVQHEGVFYLKSRSGIVYAKLRFDMSTRWDQRGVPFGISAVVNTNASRNLRTPVGR